MEIWKEIADFPDYQISNQGRIKTLKYGSESIMTPCLKKTGYFEINLYNKEGRYTKLIHRLVADAFLNKVDDKLTVDHIDRNRLNNTITNLRWADMKEQKINSAISYKNTNTGEKNIHLCDRNYYTVQIKRQNEKYKKRFKTLEEAIQYRDLILSEV